MNSAPKSISRAIAHNETFRISSAAADSYFVFRISLRLTPYACRLFRISDLVFRIFLRLTPGVYPDEGGT